MTSSTDFDAEALREKYLLERDKRLRADGNAQYVEIAGGFADYLHDPYVDRIDRPALTDDVDGRHHRRRLRRPRHRRPAPPRRDRRHPDHREGRRLRRHLVLEPLSRRPMRRRVLRLPPPARGDGVRPVGEVRPRARDPRALSPHRHAFRPVLPRLPLHRGHRDRVGRGPRAGGRSAPIAATSCRRVSSSWGTGRCTAPSCRASPASRTSVATPSTPAAGTTAYTGGDSNGGLTGLSDKRVGDHRDGRDGRAGCPSRRRRRGRALCLPAHALLHRRPRQPAHRPVLGGRPHPGLAEGARGELHDPHLRRDRRTGPGHGRMDRHHRQTPHEVARPRQRRSGRR